MLSTGIPAQQSLSHARARAGCLARPPQPSQPSAPHFQVRKQRRGLRARLWQGRTRNSARGPSLSGGRTPHPVPPLLWLLGSPGQRFTFVLGCFMSRGLGASCHRSLGLFILPAGPPVELAGHKLSTINKTKISALALTSVSWCIFFKSLMVGSGGAPNGR